MPLKLYRENLTKTKDNWPLHVFFISLGSPLFGVGFAALPVILLLIWLVFELKRHPGELIKVIQDERNLVRLQEALLISKKAILDKSDYERLIREILKRYPHLSKYAIKLEPLDQDTHNNLERPCYNQASL